MTQWEYKVLRYEAKAVSESPNFEKGLNLLGEDGWNLIQVLPNFIFIFRRPKRG